MVSWSRGREDDLLDYEIEIVNFSFYIGPKVQQNTIYSNPYIESTTVVLSDIYIGV